MRRLAYALLVSVLLAAPAGAACYQGIGCTDEDEFDASDLEELKCSALWELRNVIYYEAGYCFKTKRAISFFGNDQCEFDDAGDIEFTEIEQANIDAIAAVEKERGC